MSSPLPLPAARLAEHQYGAIGRAQLRAWSSPAAIDGLVTRGTLVRLERGVYRVAASAISPEQRAVAAILRARPGARASGPFVLGLLDVDGFDVEAPFLVLTAPGRRLSNVSFPHRHAASWDVPRTVRRIPAVDPASAIVEAADPRWAVADRAVRLAVDHARWRGLISTADLVRRIEDAAGSGGALRLARLFGEGGLTAESDGERAVTRLLEGIDPEPVRQFWIDDRYRLDLFWPDLGLAVEYDGAVDHSGPAARARDADRDRALARLGIEVVRLTATDLRRPNATRRDLTERLLARATARLAEG